MMGGRHSKTIDCYFNLRKVYLVASLEHPLVIQDRLKKIHKQPLILRGLCPPLVLLSNPKEPDGDERTTLKLLKWLGRDDVRLLWNSSISLIL